MECIRRRKRGVLLPTPTGQPRGIEVDGADALGPGRHQVARKGVGIDGAAHALFVYGVQNTRRRPAASAAASFSTPIGSAARMPDLVRFRRGCARSRTQARPEVRALSFFDADGAGSAPTAIPV